eukprot:GFUD01022842.1.p1 GENE.GFUD01022842.1~~GFUD01022842.1.p1  ORF type:complete len:123 (+),score=38.30 GFUD01022842.1:140-508(+)
MITKTTLVLCLSTLLPMTESLQCIQCGYTGASADCDQGTQPATECPAGLDSCVSVYLTGTKSMARSCMDTADKESVDNLKNHQFEKCATDGCNNMVVSPSLASRGQLSCVLVVVLGMMTKIF